MLVCKYLCEICLTENPGVYSGNMFVDMLVCKISLLNMLDWKIKAFHTPCCKIVCEIF